MTYLTHLIFTVIIFLYSGITVFRLIQLKEYFFPSIFAHFDYPSSYIIFFKRTELILWLLWLLFVLLAIFGMTFQINTYWLIPLSIILIILLIKRKEQLRLINYTPKAIFILFVAFLINYRILQYGEGNLTIATILLTTSFQFCVYLLSTYLANIITKLYANILYKKAERKILNWLNKDKKRKVIGITGSYGKTSTKEILAQLLSKKYKVLKSPKRLNAEIGLSQFILNSELENYELIILEMGARQTGELETMVNIFHPKIAFLTGLAPQHLATFGSLENIIKGEGLEIFKELDSDGIAFLNGANELVAKIYEELNVNQKYLYASEKGSFYSKNEIFSLDGTGFDFIYPGGEISLKTNLVGRHFLENLIGALACAYILGIKPEELKEEIQNIILLPHQFEIVRKENPVIIDDSYNANLVGVKRALEFFLQIPLSYRIVFFAGILELGVETPNIYYSLVQDFKKVDKIILTFRDYAEVFLENIYNKVVIYRNEDIKEILKDYPLQETGILILGRIPNKLLEEIRNL
jgi:UDP-N-acetylmuramoyl-tripeptide--D-alanyl-D-alanine ligase